ncbi:MAG: FtsW/RodA/SpoVE family cell cycle protein [Prevotellaceae bacterium]|jgi:cell division protein FtsW|nr:FtsW/RodA/SpoVE family cell cycle protein [Prevotellaceae bacterium]
MDLLRTVFKGDKVVWMIFLMFCLVSVVEVFSAGASLTYKTGDYWAPITWHIVLVAIGVLIVYITHNVACGWFKIIAYIGIPLSIFLLLFVLLKGVSVGDASRWISIFGVTFQPSELAKLSVVVTVASILATGQNEAGASPNAFTYCMIVTGVVCGLIVTENLSTAALLFGVVFLMMIIGRVEAKKLLLTLLTLGVLGGLGVLYKSIEGKIEQQKEETAAAASTDDNKIFHRDETWASRIEHFLTPETSVPVSQYKVTDKNAQVAHARIAVATSHLLGKGPGNSVQRDFLSLAFSDFISAIIIEEFGLLPAAFVLLLYLILLLRVGRIARKCDRTFPAFLVIGLALMLVTQALFNMAVAVGLAPVTGQTLPLISKGGTSIWINCIYIGIILSVSRYTAKLDEERAALEAQRLHDARIPLEITTGGEEFSDAQTADEPTSELLNNDESFN